LAEAEAEEEARRSEMEWERLAAEAEEEARRVRGCSIEGGGEAGGCRGGMIAVRETLTSL